MTYYKGELVAYLATPDKADLLCHIIKNNHDATYEIYNESRNKTMDVNKNQICRYTYHGMWPEGRVEYHPNLGEKK